MKRIIENNERKDICGNCGGRCCKRYAGCYTPDDFDDVGKEVEDLFKKELISVDKWEGILITPDWSDEEAIFIRPRHKPSYCQDRCVSSGPIFDNSFGGECIHLSENGCLLNFDNRPMFCKLLVPVSTQMGSNGEIQICEVIGYNFDGNINEKYEAAVAWHPYKKFLERMLQKFDY